MKNSKMVSYPEYRARQLRKALWFVTSIIGLSLIGVFAFAGVAIYYQHSINL